MLSYMELAFATGYKQRKVLAPCTFVLWKKICAHGLCLPHSVCLTVQQTQAVPSFCAHSYCLRHSVYLTAQRTRAVPAFCAHSLCLRCSVCWTVQQTRAVPAFCIMQQNASTPKEQNAVHIHCMQQPWDCCAPIPDLDLPLGWMTPWSSCFLSHIQPCTDKPELSDWTWSVPGPTYHG